MDTTASVARGRRLPTDWIFVGAVIGSAFISVSGWWLFYVLVRAICRH